jgi:integrase
MTILLKKRLKPSNDLAVSSAAGTAVTGQTAALPSPPKTLGDVRARLDAVAGHDRRTMLEISAINTVARVLGCTPHDLPADPAKLRQLIDRVSPAMARLTAASWSSVRSRLLAALRRTHVPVMAGRRTSPLTPAWAALYDALPDASRQAALGRFIGWLSDHAIPPEQVSDEIVARFVAEMASTSLRGRPAVIMRGAIRGWNAAATAVPGWPSQRLTLPAPARTGYVLPLAEFPAGFQASLAAYLDFLADPPEEDDAPLRGLRPNTLALRAFQFRQMASALVHRGVALVTLDDIAVLTHRPHIDKICEFFIAHSGGTGGTQLVQFLQVLRPYVLQRLRDTELAAWIGRRIRRLLGGRPQRGGITAKNRRRLAIFRDPAQVRDLVLLPLRLLKRAEVGDLAPVAAARLVRTAVAIELEIMCPIRLQNLSEIDVDRDFLRHRVGRRTSLHLFIPGSRTKNGEDIELELPRETAALIDLYMTRYRPLLIDPAHRAEGSRMLFPKTDGRAKVGRVLAAGLCSVMRRELGIDFNVHLFRHLGCFLYLRSHPGEIDVMRRVLGHKNVATTLRFYAFIEQSEAFRLFDQHVLDIREAALRPARPGPRVSRQGDR